jgi:hypothetical protein
MAKKKLGFIDYVKEAFNLKVPVPALGKVPVNWLGLVGMGALTLFTMQPFILLIGAGVELSYLYLLSTNPRFQKVIQGMELLKTKEMWEEKKNRIFSRLTPIARAKYQELEAKSEGVIRIIETATIETGQLDESYMVVMKTLNQILWSALKLLLSRELIVRNIKSEPKDALQKKIDNLEKNLQNETSDRIKKTLESTIELMKKRLQNINDADEKIKGIDLELLRLEEQIEFLQNKAALDGQAGSLSERIDSIASSIKDNDEFMQINKELFSGIEEEIEEPPDGIVGTEKTI